MNSSLISIAMTTYNGEKYLRKQLDSLINQTYKNLEIVICDDCSNDTTREILKDYAEKYSNIKVYLNEENLGFTKNFEKAIKLCNGEYIALCDQDDIWFPEKIEVCFNEIREKSVLFSSQKIIDKNDNLIYEIYPNEKEAQIRMEKCNYDYFKMLHFRNFCTGCTSLIKKDFVDKFLPIPQDVYHDWWIAFIAAYYNELVYIKMPLMYYRHHSNNETATFRLTDKNKKRRSDIVYLFNSFFSDSYKQTLIKKYKHSINLLQNLCVHLSMTGESEIYIQNCLKLYQSILNFKFSIEDIKLIYFQFKNRKYMSNQWTYFWYLIMMRIILNSLQCEGIKLNEV